MKTKYIVQLETYNDDTEEVECYLSEEEVEEIAMEIDGMKISICEYKTTEGEIITSDKIISIRVK